MVSNKVKGPPNSMVRRAWWMSGFLMERYAINQVAHVMPLHIQAHPHAGVMASIAHDSGEDPENIRKIIRLSAS
jgi:hypothetical protein